MKPLHAKKMSRKNKGLTITLCIVLAVCCAVGGSFTYAWLFHHPDSQVIIMTGSNLAITIGNEDIKTDCALIPGSTIKDVNPRINTSTLSDINYNIYARVEKSADFDTYLDYAYDSRWTVVETNGNVEYLCHTQLRSDPEYTTEELAIFSGDELRVYGTIVKSTEFATATPSVTVTACAVQLDAITEAEQLTIVKEQLG